MQYWFIFMMAYKLEVITLQDIVYFVGKRVIIVKESAIYGIVLNSLWDLENSGCFRKLSAHARNEVEALLGSNSEICVSCSCYNSLNLEILSAKLYFHATSIRNNFEFMFILSYLFLMNTFKNILNYSLHLLVFCMQP